MHNKHENENITQHFLALFFFIKKKRNKKRETKNQKSLV